MDSADLRGVGLRNHGVLGSGTHAFVVRIWWEPGLSRPDGHPLWRGKIEHAASGQYLVFQTLDDLLGFVQSQTGELDSPDKGS